jgi:hypothetical protein
MSSTWIAMCAAPMPLLGWAPLRRGVLDQLEAHVAAEQHRTAQVRPLHAGALVDLGAALLELLLQFEPESLVERDRTVKVGDRHPGVVHADRLH